MQKPTLAKIWYATVAVLYVLVHFIASGPIIAMVDVLGFWSYPVLILAGFGLNTFVLIILIPLRKKRMASFLTRWSDKFRDGHERRMQRRFWRWIAKGGPFVLVLVFTLALGPLTGSLAARFQGLDEVRAWRYSLISTVLATVVTVSVYLGVADPFMDFISTVFSFTRAS